MTPSTTDSADLLRVLQDLRIGFEIVTERVSEGLATQSARPRRARRAACRGAGDSEDDRGQELASQPTTLTAILTRLERDGRVSRYRNPDDARSSMLAVPNRRCTR